MTERGIKRSSGEEAASFLMERLCICRMVCYTINKYAIQKIQIWGELC